MTTWTEQVEGFLRRAGRLGRKALHMIDVVCTVDARRFDETPQKTDAGVAMLLQPQLYVSVLLRLHHSPDEAEDSCPVHDAAAAGEVDDMPPPAHDVATRRQEPWSCWGWRGTGRTGTRRPTCQTTP